MTFQTLQKSNPKKTFMCGKKLSGAEKLSFVKAQNSSILHIYTMYPCNMPPLKGIGLDSNTEHG
jgi:hypothetical protein